MRDATIRFTDGVNLAVGGEDYRVTRRRDGFYVVGRGLAIPVADREEGAEVIAELRAPVEREG